MSETGMAAMADFDIQCERVVAGDKFVVISVDKNGRIEVSVSLEGDHDNGKTRFTSIDTYFQVQDDGDVLEVE